MFEKLPETVDEFYGTLLATSLVALKLNTFFDNFDKSRFNLDGRDHSMEFNPQERALYFDWFFNSRANLFDAYRMLEDSHSRLLYLNLIAYRLAGHHSVRLPLEWAQNGAGLAAYRAAEGNPEPSELGVRGIFGNLKHYDFGFNGSRYVLDCTGGLEYYLFRRQYFYARDGVSIAPEPGDYVLDAGACMGDTALVFSNAVGPAGRVFAFDPVAEHLTILRHNIGQFPHRNVSAVARGVSNREVDCEPLIINCYNPGFRSNNQAVPLCSIDAFVRGNELARLDFIKMDIEGAELDALLGAQASIHRFKPKLAISLYHKPNDIFELIRHVKSSFPFYRIYIDHYTIHQEETVMYCAA